MRQMSVHQFRRQLKSVADQVSDDHEPLLVTRRSSEDFVVVSATDWEQQQETLYVLQNPSLMNQIQKSLESHKNGTGYRPTAEELDEIAGL